MTDKKQLIHRLPRIHPCRTCRHYTHQPCYVAGAFEMSPHCAKWYKCFMRDDPGWSCVSYEREPGADDE